MSVAVFQTQERDIDGSDGARDIAPDTRKLTQSHYRVAGRIQIMFYDEFSRFLRPPVAAPRRHGQGAGAGGDQTSRYSVP